MKDLSRLFVSKRAIACAFVSALLVCALAQEPSNREHGIIPGDIDRSVKPGDNFFDYTNGEWIKRTEIPADRASVSVFSKLVDVSNKRTAGLIEDAAKSKGAEGSGARKISDLYNSFMDESGIEARGVAPLKPHLDEINAIHDRRDLSRALGQSLRADVDALNNTNFHTDNLFGMWVAPNFDDSGHYIAYLMQGGLELPDREYYLSDSEQMKSIRTKYQEHVSAILKLAGFSDPDSRATRLIELEHAIAEKHWTLAEDQDTHKANNHWKRSDFASKAPGLEWDEYFHAAGLADQREFIVWQPSAFVSESALVASTPMETWKDWLAYHLIEDYAAALPKAFVDERFAFFGKVLSGIPQQRPRAQRGVLVVNGVLGDEVGKLYAKQYFPPEAKARAQTMVTNIVAAFRKRLEAITWMTPATKKEALTKLNALYVGIGYPETWHDYTGLEIKSDDIFGNLWRAELFEFQKRRSQLGKAVDSHEWSMTPQTVNAVNLPLQNALNFPAAILEPPFYDSQAADAYNYGAIGTVIGHEVSHTFDSEGSSFDAKGQMRDWWTAEDMEHFKVATAKLAAQYDTYKPFPDLSLNGKQTLAENIADLGGIAASYDAYRAAGANAHDQDGFSPDQQFFIAYGQSRRWKGRDATLRQQVLTDSHSPSEYRTEMVRNNDAWYESFKVQPGEKLYLGPEERVRIW